MCAPPLTKTLPCARTRAHAQMCALFYVGTSSCLRNIPRPTRHLMPNTPTQMCCPCACNKAQGHCIANCNTNVLPMHLQQSPRFRIAVGFIRPIRGPIASSCWLTGPRTQIALKLKEGKKQMDVINILINPSEKAKCGHGAMLATVPPGAAAAGRLWQLQAGGAGVRARPGAAASPRCAWRNRTSSSTWSTCVVFLVRHRLLREFDGVLYGISRLKL